MSSELGLIGKLALFAFTGLLWLVLGFYVLAIAYGFYVLPVLFMLRALGIIE